MARAAEGDLPDAELPHAGAHLWSWFCDLAAARSATGFGGINPIDHKEIAAWAALSRNMPTPWEVRTLMRMDRADRAVMAEQAPRKTISGSVQDASDPDAVKAMFRAMGAQASGGQSHE